MLLYGIVVSGFPPSGEILVEEFDFGEGEVEGEGRKEEEGR